jgi:ornithine cyclodeaminase
MLILSQPDLVRLLEPAALVAAVEAAAAADEREFLAPRRQHLEWRGNSLLTMPALADDFVGVKLVSVVPGNAARNLPVTNGVMVLSDGESAVPVAVMNAAILTAMRTGAVGALAVKYMTPADTTSVGIIGCGVQGAWQAIFASAVRPVDEVFCVARSAARLASFMATVGQHAPRLRITPCQDARELLRTTGVVIAATTAEKPVLPDEPALLENKHFISIGSYRPTMQELPDAVYRLAGHIVIDCEAARHEVGDVIGPLRRQLVKESDVYPVGELVTGRRSVDTARTTACKTVGMALFDLCVARALYARARLEGLGTEVVL